MKIRVLSDLHLDINKKAPLTLGDDVFTIIAGDISGYPEKTAEWLEHNVKRGAFISGNHDVYSTDMPIEDVKKFFASKFPASSDVTYFDNEVGCISKEIDDNVLLVGDVMYTDYELKIPGYCSDDDSTVDVVKTNMSFADPFRNFHRSGMNDFNYGTCRKSFGKAGALWAGKHCRLVPEYYLEHFKNAFKAVTDIVESNPTKDIILMTHHCLSPKCISSDYVDDVTNASYVSDKDSWIASHPNIKVIVSGHVHSKAQFNVGSTKYILNPLGYYAYYSSRNDGKFEFDDIIVDTGTWEVECRKNGLKCGID